MKRIITTVLFLSLTACLASCASSEVKAPCDYEAHFCGSKVKINQW